MPPRAGRKPGFLTVVLLVLALAAIAAYLAWRQSAPAVRASLTPSPRAVGQSTPVSLVLEAARGGVARAEVRIVQDGKAVPIWQQTAPTGPRLETRITVQAGTGGLKEGAATLEVWARDDYWRPWRRDDRPALAVPVTIDLTPPSIEILAATRYLYQGGGGLVAFRVRGGPRAEVRAGALTFPSFPVGDDATRVALIALPWDLAADTPLSVTAQDEAGNSASRPIPSEVRTRRFRTDTIQVTDAMLRTKVPELLPQHPSSRPLLDGFLVINRDQRRQAEEEKRRLAARTADHALWEGPFVQPRNTKVFSNFAETRVYVYQGQTVDTQVHLGYDLASLKQSPIPAANKGVVVFAGPLTIYGNTVVIDHGLGLQTLYGHMSSIGVKVGDTVDKGRELGRSGATGLALGDHLHFEVLINGISVTPIEWWDAKWIRDHIGQPLLAAGLPAIGKMEQSAADAPAPAVKRAPSGRRPKSARARR